MGHALFLTDHVARECSTSFSESQVLCLANDLVDRHGD